MTSIYGVKFYSMDASMTYELRNKTRHSTRARSETVYAGMVYRHFFGWLEIILPFFSGRLPYRYAVGRSIAATFTVHSALHAIWSVDRQEN